MIEPRRGKVARAVLGALARGVGIALDGAIDGLVALTQPSGGDESRAQRAVAQVLKRFEEHGLIRRTTDSQPARFVLTDRGRQRLEQYTLDGLTLPERPTAWDGQWRIVLFDVPEKRRQLRAIFRRKLQQLGFVYLQKSSWLYPFPCEAALTELAQRLGLQPNVVVATAQQLSNEEKFLQRFKLSRSDNRDDYHFVSLSEIGS